MSTLFERFSSRDNLKKAYTYVQNELTYSSLSVNPINHPALTAINGLGDQFFVALEKYIRDGKYTPERGFFVYIPKDNLGLRPVCVISMIDRIVYQAMFNQNILGYKIDGQLSDKVCFANRVNDDEAAASFISPYFNGWDDFCKVQKKSFEKGFVWKAEFDVQQYYEHIPTNKLIQKLKDDFGIKDEKILSLLKSQLYTWAEYHDLPKGIPQGPDPSAVLGNVYLSSLDRYAEDELISKDLRYFRYADDITLMGKSRKDILKATEKIVHFLREHNLNLNEKTKLFELQDAETIEAMRITSDYDDNSPEIPEDDFNRIQEKVPLIIQTIAEGSRVEKQELRELKYYLKVGRDYSESFITELIGIIPLRPSLTIPIVQYVSDGCEFLNIFGEPIDVFSVNYALWEAYKNSEISEWSKFWILKLLVSNNDAVLPDGISDEVQNILTSKGATIFKIVSFYYQAIQRGKIDIELVKTAIKDSSSDVEKSLYSFFLLNAFDGVRLPIIRDCVEKTINSTSQEMNLVGCYLYQANPKITIDDIEGAFSAYILKRKTDSKKTRVSGTTTTPTLAEYYIVRGDTLSPFTAPPTTILGLKRKKKGRHSVELVFPEAIKWEKVELKMKTGLRDIEIFYDGTHIKTTGYTELGFFSGSKQQKPDRQWSFLCCLSVLSGTDITQATANNMMTMIAKDCGHAISKPAVYKIKEILAKKLRSLFNTDDDPFNDRRDYYHPKFTILPEADLRQTEVWPQGGRLNENRSYEDTDTD